MDVFAQVFSEKSRDHPKYEPVFKWINEGDGKIVYGGETYWKQLKQSERKIDVINEYKNKDKVFKICDNCVDIKEKEAARLIGDSTFNDPHLAGILMVSNCRLVCSRDEGARENIKKIFKGTGFNPRFYTGLGSKNILTRRYIPNNIQKCMGLCLRKTIRKK